MDATVQPQGHIVVKLPSEALKVFEIAPNTYVVLVSNQLPRYCMIS